MKFSLCLVNKTAGNYRIARRLFIGLCVSMLRMIFSQYPHV